VVAGDATAPITMSGVSGNAVPMREEKVRAIRGSVCCTVSNAHLSAISADGCVRRGWVTAEPSSPAGPSTRASSERKDSTWESASKASEGVDEGGTEREEAMTKATAQSTATSRPAARARRTAALLATGQPSAFSEHPLLLIPASLERQVVIIVSLFASSAINGRTWKRKNRSTCLSFELFASDCELLRRSNHETTEGDERRQPFLEAVDHPDAGSCGICMSSVALTHTLVCSRREATWWAVVSEASMQACFRGRERDGASATLSADETRAMRA
jgi:hypothetical protein